MTPHFFSSMSPILRVISRTPLTRGRPTLLHVIRPPHRSMRSCSLVNSGSWSLVSCRAAALRHSSARLSPTCATASSAPFLMTQTVAVLPLDSDTGARSAPELLLSDIGLSRGALAWLCLPVYNHHHCSPATARLTRCAHGNTTCPPPTVRCSPAAAHPLCLRHPACLASNSCGCHEY